MHQLTLVQKKRGGKNNKAAKLSKSLMHHDKVHPNKDTPIIQHVQQTAENARIVTKNAAAKVKSIGKS